MKHDTLLQIYANDILNIFIHIEQAIESNTIRRIYLDNKELFKLLSEDINKNLEMLAPQNGVMQDCLTKLKKLKLLKIQKKLMKREQT